MKYSLLLVTFSAVVLGVVLGLPSNEAGSRKILDMSATPQVPRETFGRSVNLSFFVPAFSLFALASQFMPQMFPSLTTTTSSRRQRREAEGQSTADWIENVIANGLLY